MEFRKAAPALIWTLIVGILTLLPGRDLPEVRIVNFDKVAHLGVFALLEWLYLNWLSIAADRIKRGILITLCCIAFGGTIEVLQGTLYTDRYADVWDFIFNGLGCCLGVFVFSRTCKNAL
jgi:VanZ family protein